MERPRYLMLVTAGWRERGLRETYSWLQSRGDVEVVAFSPAARQILQRSGVPYSQPADYTDRLDEFDLNRAAIGELNQYPTRLVGGSPLGEQLRYQEIPLWNFISPNLFADVNALLKSLAILEKIINRQQPDFVVGLDGEALPSWFNYIRGVAKEGVLIDRLAQQLCLSRGLGWVPLAPGYRLRLRHCLSHLVGRAMVQLRGGMWLMAGAALVRRSMERALDLVLPARRRADPRPAVLFFSHKKYWRKDYNPIKSRMAGTDTATYPVIHRLLEGGRYQVKAVDGNYSFVGGLGALWGKLCGEREVRWQTFDAWYPLAQVWKCRKDLRACEEVLAKRGDLCQVFSIRGLETGKFFLPKLEFLIRDYLWKSAVWIEAARRMVRCERPALVALAYETGTLSRAIINACREAGVPTLGLQHGAFSESTDDYVKSPHNHVARLTPDKTAVWGERFRRVMVEHSAFQEDEVVVTGNPRMDFLFTARSLLDTESLYRKYHLNRNRKIILLAPNETIGRTRHLAKDRFFEGAIAAKRALGDCQWIVKLKPGADSKGYYQALMKKHGETGMVLTEEDLYPLLVAAALVVTPPSSIAIEALIVGRPVVYVVFPDAEDYFPHLSRQRAVFPVHDVQSLPTAIEAVLARGEASALAPEALRALLEGENYQPDGQAAGRVVEVIEELIARRGTAGERSESLHHAQARG